MTCLWLSVFTPAQKEGEDEEDEEKKKIIDALILHVDRRERWIARVKEGETERKKK